MHTTLRAFARLGLLAAIGLGMALLWVAVAAFLSASDARASDRAEDGLLGGVSKAVGQLAEPVVEKVVEPVAEKVVTPVAEKVVKPTAEKVAEPVTKVVAPAAETVEKVAKPVTDKVVKPVTDKVVKPVTDKVVKPVTDKIVKPVTDKVVKPVAENVVAPVVTPVTVKVVKPVTETVVAPVVTPVTDAVKPVTDALKPVTDGVVEPVVEAVAPITDGVVTPVVEAVLPPVVDAVSPVTDPVVDAVAPVIPPVVGAVDPIVDPIVPDLPLSPVEVPGSNVLPGVPAPSAPAESEGEPIAAEPAVDTQIVPVPTRSSATSAPLREHTSALVATLFSEAVAQAPAADAAAVSQHPLVFTDPVVPAPSAPASESGSLTSTSTGGAAGLIALLPFGIPVAHRAWARRGRPTDEQGLPAPFFDTDVSPD